MNSARPVPFAANLKDEMHCVQASLKMMLEYLLPDRQFSWEELEKLTAKIPGKSTWPAQMLINLRQMNFDVSMIESFDAEAFMREGGDYLRREFGKQTADWQIANSDIPQEQRLYREMLQSGVDYQKRVPTIEDIKKYLQQGYLVKLTVNSCKLNDRPGYIGHSIVVYGVDEQHVTFNDPGPPATPARVETIEHLQAAWADPNDQAKELIAVKYRG